MDIFLRFGIIALLFRICYGHIIIFKKNQTIEEFYDLPAQFGPSIPLNGLQLLAVESTPRNACFIPQKPPKLPYYEEYKLVLVIARNNCTFEDKVRNAQSAGYDAAIIYNIGSDDLEQMSAENGSNIKIPSVFVGETTGIYIIEAYLFDSGFSLMINNELPFNINTHLIIPFSILVGLCFIIMIAYMIFKCAREQRRLRQHRLPKRLLKKIPTLKFTKGLPYETCVICLDEYVEGDKLRVLPCQHAYHCGCIDTWLTKNRRVCPICKRKVFPKGESSRRSRRRPASSDSMSDTETDDTTPLLNQNEINSNNANHGTFNNNNNNNNNHNSNTRTNNQNQNNENSDQTTDEENVLTRSNTSNEQRQGRSNPFDRSLNNNENIVRDVTSISRRILNIFSIFRLFRRNDRPLPQNLPNSLEDQINSIVSVGVSLASQPSSNNILNSNLSGSFRNDNNEDNNDDNDDYVDEQRTIYEPINTNNSNTSQISNSQIGTEPLDSVFIQTPLKGCIGVAALPNTSFNSNNIVSNHNNRNNSAILGRPSASSSSSNTRQINKKNGSLYNV